MDACLENGDLETAKSIFEQACESDVQLSMTSVNAVVNAFAQKGDVDTVAELIGLARQHGVKPDKFTVAAVLHACQRANTGELAFKLWRSVSYCPTV